VIIGQPMNNQQRYFSFKEAGIVGQPAEPPAAQILSCLLDFFFCYFLFFIHGLVFLAPPIRSISEDKTETVATRGSFGPMVGRLMSTHLLAD
jgi:hypothetical protein